jgi:hypothetical protein
MLRVLESAMLFQFPLRFESGGQFASGISAPKFFVIVGFGDISLICLGTLLWISVKKRDEFDSTDDVLMELID